MTITIDSILKQELEMINPSNEELNMIKKETALIIKELESKIKSKKIKAKVFIGGSFAKNTLIKKDKYDVDIFIRFDSKLSEGDMARIVTKIIPTKAQRIHGSRDYFLLKSNNSNVRLEFEIIPVINISSPEKARNITDLSYFHVKYVAQKIKKQKDLANQIKLAKAFIHYQGCYGAESYIHGFSGYAVELLLVHYKSLKKMLEAFTKFSKEKKIVIDSEKFFKNSAEVLVSLNEAKLQSPIILVDPTFRDRNALASLSEECFEKIKVAAQKFLKNPNQSFFKHEDKTKRFEKYSNLIEIEIKTDRQPGDIAGTKLKKFYGFLIKHSSRYFDIKDSEFFYDETDSAKIFIVANPKKDILFRGPPVTMIEPMKKFKAEHKNVVIQNNIAYSSEKGYSSFSDFINDLRKEPIVKNMGVNELKVID